MGVCGLGLVTAWVAKHRRGVVLAPRTDLVSETNSMGNKALKLLLQEVLPKSGLVGIV